MATSDRDLLVRLLSMCDQVKAAAEVILNHNGRCEMLALGATVWHFSSDMQEEIEAGMKYLEQLSNGS